MSGPTYGGTRLTIEGSNLGQSFEEISNRISVGNVPCRPIEEEYRPSNRIVCITGPVMSNRFASIGQQQHLSGKRFDSSLIIDPLDSSSSPSSSSSSSSIGTIFGDVTVGNRAGFSVYNQKFQFKSIYLRDHQPRFGPQSGGTRITLTGINLNVGSSIQVFLDELPCLVELSLISSEQIVCKTSPSKQPSRAIRQLRLIIDDAQIIRDENVFYYTQDPTISRIFPLRSYLSGGRPINVYGTNLTSVQVSKMVILDLTTGKRVNESICQLQDDTRMQCPSPAVNLASLDQLADSQWNEHNYDPYSGSSSTWIPIAAATNNNQRLSTPPVAQEESTVRFRVSFIMDDVWRRKDLHTSSNNNNNNLLLNTEISYTSDPKVYPFASAEYKSSQESTSLISVDNGDLSMNNAILHQAATHGKHQTDQYQLDSDTYLLQPGEPILVLYGEHLRTAISDYEITVTIGMDLCNFTQLTQTKIICSVPLDHMATPTDEEGHQTQRELPLVVVRIGFNLRYEIGYVQYHPQLVEQIFQNVANTSPNAQQQLAFMRAAGPNYIPRENESFFQKLGQYVLSTILLAIYMLLAVSLIIFLYSTFLIGYRYQQTSKFRNYFKTVQSVIDTVEESVKSQCRLNSMALQSELNELIRHVDLSGCPIFPLRQHIMKVFFPGIKNHPLAVPVKSSFSANTTNSNILNIGMEQQQLQHQPIMHPIQIHSSTIQRPLMSANSLEHTPIEHFERLIMNKSFLITFINTLERQPSFTIRDKVNVASLLMVCLLNRLDYATDVMRTLLLQLIERSVNRNQLIYEKIEGSSPGIGLKQANQSSFKSRAFGFLKSLPISKARALSNQTSRGNNLSRVVSGSANSLMNSTQVAAQMLLARVGGKCSPPNYLMDNQNQASAGSPLEENVNSMTLNGKLGHCMSTTTFNQPNALIQTIEGRVVSGGKQQARSRARCFSPINEPFDRFSSMAQLDISTSQASSQLSSGNRIGQENCNGVARSCSSSGTNQTGHSDGSSIHLMLRRTESIVEKMLTNWLAINMHDSLHGEAGRALYMMFEALRYQLDRGPVDAVSGEARNSLSDSKLLREFGLVYRIVNLYVIVDTEILNSNKENTSNQGEPQSIYDDPIITLQTNNSNDYQTSANNTITLSLRVLDCDTISQVKTKVLNALYRNSPFSSRLSIDDVELSMRQQLQSNGVHYNTINLRDEDYSNTTAPNGMKRLNTLGHYGVNDQAILMLNKKRNSRLEQGQTNLTEMLDNNYNNPYSEIQYGSLIGANNIIGISPIRNKNVQRARWHLVRPDLVDSSISQRASLYIQQHLHEQSEDSSPAPNSPSMMLLDNSIAASNQLRQQTYYHPSSTSNSSLGNGTLDAVNPNSMSTSVDVTNNLLTIKGNERVPPAQQPIYCQIGSISTRSQHDAADSGYYCQINQGNNSDYQSSEQRARRDQHQVACLNMLFSSKGSVQNYIDDFFKTILSAKSFDTVPDQMVNNKFNTVLCGNLTATNGRDRGLPNSACPPAVKWLFDLLDEAAMVNGISDQGVIHSWKSNAFLLRFWLNLVKNPNHILDVDKSNTLDANLSVIAQALIDTCSNANFDNKAKVSYNPRLCSHKEISKHFLTINDTNNIYSQYKIFYHTIKDSTMNKILFAKDIPKYKSLVKQFYQDIANSKPVSDQEVVEHMSSQINAAGANSFDTNLALKELCVYAVNYGMELMSALNNDFNCQQLSLAHELEQCFRSFTVFEAYR